jgi:serine/threonine-protein kinase RsbW
MATTLELSLANDPAEIGRLVDRLEMFATDAGLAPDVAFRLMLSLDEAVSNVIHHGFDDDGEHRIAVRVEIGASTVTSTVIDDGRPFDPRDAPPPDLDAALDARRAGGLGMHLVRASMDTIEYRRDGARNVLTLTTSLASRAGE